MESTTNSFYQHYKSKENLWSRFWNMEHILKAAHAKSGYVEINKLYYLQRVARN